jgi:drug/metabolite transporter (DMT)-like permease
MKKNWAGYFHLLVVYIVWGSNFIAIRSAARSGSGFPPFALGASRVVMGAFLVFFIAKLRGKSLRIPRKSIFMVFSCAVLLWVGGHGLVVWASQFADSSYAAVLMGAVPLWVVSMESILDRRWPSKGVFISLAIGFSGIVLLSWPQLVIASAVDASSGFALICAPVFWSAGTIIQKRSAFNLSPWVNSGYQQLFAGLVFIILSILFQEPLPSPTPAAWAAWGYLVVFGSVIAFTSYVMAVQLLPMNVVMTYCYVNPVIAVFLGYFLLQEKITLWMTGGSIFLLLGVAGTFRAVLKK